MATSDNFNANGTMLANLVNPQVLADMIDKKLVDYIKFAPLAVIDNTLEGRPGDTLTLPSYNYIGDAVAFGEAEDISIGQLTAGTKTVKVSKFGRGVELTDEAMLSGYGDPLGEAVKQIGMALGSYEDNAMLACMENSVLEYHFESALTADTIAEAEELFGEDIEGEKVLLISPAMYTALRKADDWCPASEIAAELIIKGAVGMIHGCQVVISNKLKGKDEAFIVKPGALRIFLKRGVLVETDRDIIAKFTVITADKHSVCYIYDDSKIIRICKAEAASGLTVSSAEGSASGETVITVTETAGTGNKFVYKAASGIDVPDVGDVYGGTALPEDGVIETTDGYIVVVAEVDGNGKVVKAGKATADVKA